MITIISPWLKYYLIKFLLLSIHKSCDYYKLSCLFPQKVPGIVIDITVSLHQEPLALCPSLVAVA